MAYNNDAPFRVRKHIQLINGVNIDTLIADATLTVASSTFQILNGGAADYDVNLPAEVDGIHFWITNAGATNNLVVKDLTPTTIATVAPGEGALFICDGAEWKLVIKA